MQQIAHAVSTLCVTLAVCIAALLGANWAAERYLQANPEILMSRDERINENTRAVRESMIPKDRITEWYALESADELKPMWQEFYDAGAEFESYVHFRSRPLEGKYYGVTQAGYRVVREQGPWPTDPANFNVFFFGGSTSFGVGPSWATVASYLQDDLNASGAVGRPVRVYNFGRSGYFSSQEIILFQRLLTNGHVPDMVVFLDGLNDFCWVDGQPSSWQMLASHFNSVNAEAQRRAAGHGVVTEWNKFAGFLTTLPLTRLLAASLERIGEEPVPQYVRPQEAVEEQPESEATLDAIIDRYFSFKRQVEGVAAEFGITPVFVWQPIPTYKYDTSHHIFNPDRLGCHVNSKYGYPRMAQRVASGNGLGENFIWAADVQEGLTEPLYIDAFHYTAPMSSRIATLISDVVIRRQLWRSVRLDAGE